MAGRRVEDCPRMSIPGRTSQSVQERGFSSQPTMGKRSYTESSIRMPIRSELAMPVTGPLVMK